MSKRDIVVLRESVIKLTQMLAGMGLIVTQRGAMAFVETDKNTLKPLRVNIPFIPDDAPDALICAIQGFIDHEVAHILCTDWKAIKAGVKLGPKQAILHNIVEDTFIEREIQKKFPGSAQNLNTLHDFFIEKITKPMLLDKNIAGKPLEEFNTLLVPIARAWAGQQKFQDFLVNGKYFDHPMVKEFVKEAQKRGIIAKFPKLKNSNETLEIAKIIHDIIYPSTPAIPPPPPPEDDEDTAKGSKGNGTKPHDEPVKKSEEEPPEHADDEQDEDAAGGGSEPEAEKSEKEENDDTPEEPEAEEEIAAEEDRPEVEEKSDKKDKKKSDLTDEFEPDDKDDGESDAKEEGDKDGSAKDSTDEGESDDAGDDDEENSESGTPGGLENKSEDNAAHDESDDKKPVESHQKEWKTSVFDGNESDIAEVAFDTALSDEFTYSATNAMREAEYRLYSTDFDLIEKYKVPAKELEAAQRGIAKLNDDSRQMVGKMQKDIERMMAQNSQVLKVPGFRRGRLNSSALHRVLIGDDRVFSKKQEAKSKDTVVSLLIDCSSSMSGNKFETAMLSGFALSQTLEKVGIAHECIGFTTMISTPGFSRRALELEEDRIGKFFSRNCPLYMPVFKEFSERLSPEVKTRFTHALQNPDFLQVNVDGECVEIASNRLLKRNEKRKVLIVLSDGNPAAQASNNSVHHHQIEKLQAVIAEVERKNVEVIGIGINSNAVKSYYKKNIVINKVDELPAAVMGELQKILTK